MAGEEAIARHAVQKKVIRKFEDQCATDPRQAMTLESLNIKNRSFTKELIKEKVIVEIADGRYYLDRDAVDAYFRKKRRAAFIGIIAALAAALIAYLIKK